MIDWLENHFATCFFKGHFGMDCPGCGMQRAFIALLKGDIIQSIELHPGLIPFILTIATLLIHLKFKHPKGGFLIMWLFILTTAVTFVNFIVKQYLFFSAQA